MIKEELELKLAATPDELERLRGDDLIRSLASRQARTTRLRTTYFDTPAYDLRQRGMALRVRQVGKRHVQTLKVPNRDGSGLQHYREYETEIEADQPDVGRIEDAALRRLFDSKGLGRGLRPVFTTAVSRRSVPLKVADAQVALALDSGEILADGKRMPICEAELELVSGSSDRIYELALALHERVDFRLETRTKAARGYQLRTGSPANPQKAQPIALEANMTVGQAVVTAVQNCLDQIRANETVMLSDSEDARDPEGLHQLRVGVRRLRALITVLKKAFEKEAYEFLRSELAWLQAALGPARDWDVFVLETLTPLCRRLSEDADLAAFRETVEMRRALANQAARAALLTPRYTDLLLRLELWLNNGDWAARTGEERVIDQPIGPFAMKALEKRAGKLHKLTRRWKTLPEKELHPLRIMAKKLRYAEECFQSLYPPKQARARIQALGRIQDTLGSLNDAVTTDALLADLEGSVPERTRALIKGWQTARIEADLKHFRADLKRYEKFRKH